MKIRSAIISALAFGAAALSAISASAQTTPVYVTQLPAGYELATMSFNAEGDILLGQYGGAQPYWTAHIIAAGETTWAEILQNPTGKMALFLNDGRIITSAVNKINVSDYTRATKTTGAASQLTTVTDPGGGNWFRSVNSVGDIYSLHQHTANVQLIRTTPTGNTATLMITDFDSSPESMIADSNGHVYVGHRDGGITRIGFDGSTSEIRAGTSGTYGVRGFAFDADENMYVSLADEHKVVKYSADMSTVTDFAEVSVPGRLAIHNNTLYIAQAMSQPTIYKVELTPPTPVPTLSEWAMILLALTLAGGTVLYVQRRRMMA